MKITLDAKSLLFGFLGAGLLIMAISFKSAQSESNGKFRTVINEQGAVVILDSESGNYIIAPLMRDNGKVQWIKGDFNSTYQTGKDNKKE